MEIILSNIVKTDFEYFHELFQEMHEYHRKYAPYFFQEYSIDCFNLERFESYLDNPNCIFIKAEDKSKFVGYISGQIHDYKGDSLTKARKFSKIEQIAVNVSYQNLGIGTKLLEEFQKVSLDSNCFNIELTAWEFNTQATNLYKKLGYINEISNYKMFL